MIGLDITALQIGGGVFAVVVYIIVAVRRGVFDVMHCAIVFLTVVAIILGVKVIYVALTDSLAKLTPTELRIYLSISGVVAIGVSVQAIINILKSLLVKPVAVTKIDSSK